MSYTTQYAQFLKSKLIKNFASKRLNSVPFEKSQKNAQCGNFMIFLSLRFYVKSNFANVEGFTAVLTIFKGSEF